MKITKASIIAKVASVYPNIFQDNFKFTVESQNFEIDLFKNHQSSFQTEEALNNFLKDVNKKINENPNCKEQVTAIFKNKYGQEIKSDFSIRELATKKYKNVDSIVRMNLELFEFYFKGVNYCLDFSEIKNYEKQDLIAQMNTIEGEDNDDFYYLTCNFFEGEALQEVIYQYKNNWIEMFEYELLNESLYNEGKMKIFKDSKNVFHVCYSIGKNKANTHYCCVSFEIDKAIELRSQLKRFKVSQIQVEKMESIKKEDWTKEPYVDNEMILFETLEESDLHTSALYLNKLFIRLHYAEQKEI